MAAATAGKPPTILYKYAGRDGSFNLYNFPNSKPKNVTITIPSLNKSMYGSFREGYTHAYAFLNNVKSMEEVYLPEMEVHVSGDVGPGGLIWAVEGTVTGLEQTNTHGEDQ
ncbi:hypothetical protein [Pseudomonas helleri]|jgi:hypothetical protein